MTKFTAENIIKGLYTVEIKKELESTFGKRCYYCRADFVPLSIDHVIPKSKGGDEYCLNNIVLACLHCNHGKGASTTKQFRYWLDYIKTSEAA